MRTLNIFINKNPYIIFIFFSLLCIFYYKYKIIGLIVSCILLFFGFLLYYNHDYTQAGIIKVYLVAIASTLLFYKLNTNWEINLNYLLTFLLALNVFVLIFTVIKNPFSKNYITSYFLAFCFLLLVVSTPFGYITKNKVELKQMFMNVNLYVILYTIILGYYFIINRNPHFKKSLYLHLSAIIIPFISHFVINKWAETRALCLCLVFIYDLL